MNTENNIQENSNPAGNLEQPVAPQKPEGTADAFSETIPIRRGALLALMEKMKTAEAELNSGKPLTLLLPMPGSGNDEPESEEERAAKNGKILEFLEEIDEGRYADEKELEKLNGEDKEIFQSAIEWELDGLKGNEFDAYYKKVEKLLNDDANKAVWETNHEKITACINNCLANNTMLPSVRNIAKITGLSRRTVEKHLHTAKESEPITERKDRYRFTEDVVIASLYKKAVSGDVQAMKYYCELTGIYRKENTAIQNQHNYIQINGMKLGDEEIKKIGSENLAQIEGIIRRALQQPAEIAAMPSRESELSSLPALINTFDNQ